VDEFNLAYAVTPGTFVDFVAHVLPEPRALGRVQSSYAAPTLRQNLGTAPGPLLAADHPGARHRRGPAGPGGSDARGVAGGGGA
jgi:hypothetical protein